MKNEKKIDMLKQKYGVSFQFVDAKGFINSKEVKELRVHLKMTQTYFAKVLGVTKKTIEKWEQGKNPVTGAAATLLFIIKNDPQVLSYVVKDSSRDFSKYGPLGVVHKAQTKLEPIFVENKIDCFPTSPHCVQSLQAV